MLRSAADPGGTARGAEHGADHRTDAEERVTLQHGQTTTGRLGGLGRLAVATAMAIGLLAVPNTAMAAPTGPSPATPEFYTVPNPLPAGEHGDLIKYRPQNASLQNLGATAYTIMYRSTGSSPNGDPLTPGAPSGVTGSVLIPKAPWRGAGPRPIVSFAVGTQGLGSNCAPSKALENNRQYDVFGLGSMLLNGYAVLMTDYAGYTNGDVHTYIAGQTLGHNVLDIVKAATQIPGSGLSPTAPVVLSGYSEGGQAVAWAGQLAPSYTPTLNLKGVAAGGVPTSLVATARSLDGGPYAGFLIDAVIGLNQAYPATPLRDLLNAKGVAALDKAVRPQECTLETILDFATTRISTLTKDGSGLDQLLAIPEWQKVLAANELGKLPIKAPVFLNGARSDDVIPPATQDALVTAYCGQGMTVQVARYPGIHVTGALTNQPDVATFLRNRFNDRAPVNNCPR